MNDNLIDFLNKLKNRHEIHTLDEAATKQTIILPILQLLGWSIFDPNEVYPEFLVENRRVDYCLRLNDQNEFFIEVKRTGEDLEQHQEQLLEYAFRQGVELAALTNGITWHFYLPMKKGDWTARRFYTIDILSQETKEISKQFNAILSKELIKDKSAIKYAETIYKSRLKKDTTLQALPKAWNRIIAEPDELLLELLSEITEKICGFKPDEDILIQFFESNRSRFLLNESSNSSPRESSVKKKIIPPIEAVKSSKLNSGNLISLPELVEMASDLIGTKPVLLKINNDNFEVKSWSDVDKKFVAWLIDHEILKEHHLPIPASKSKKKYFINSTNQHASPADAKWEKIRDGFWVDVKFNAECHIKHLYQTLEKVGALNKVKVSLIINS